MKFLILLFLLFFNNCSDIPLAPSEETPETTSFKELTYNSLRGTWIQRSINYRMFFGDEQSDEAFRQELSYHFIGLRGRYWIQGDFIAINGTYTQRSGLDPGRILLQEPRKEFYKASLTDSTLLLRPIDQGLLAQYMSLSKEVYNPDFSPEFIQAVLSTLNNIDLIQHSQIIGPTHEYASWEYYGNRLYVSKPQ